MGVADFVRMLRALPSPAERLTGRPPSANGASSHHLFWRLPPIAEPVVEVTVDLEVADPPAVDRLYFWALQASFADGGTTTGAGHLGLQHHPQYPDAGAVNWGGYHAAGSGRTGELSGSAVAASSTLDNPNTCDYRWSSEQPYRYRIARAEDGVWIGTITDLEHDDEFEIRRLYCPGNALADVVMWTEAFADCDAPPTAVRWSAPLATTASGRHVEPIGFVVGYQTVADGGCSTSNVEVDGDTYVQRTGVRRTTPAGAVLERR